MAKIFRKSNLAFQTKQDVPDEFRIATAFPRLSVEAESKNLIFDIRKLDPGKFSFPYHFHRHAEEFMLVLSGSMTLRSSESFEVLEQGDMVFFEMGPTGAHQFYNHSTEPCTYLDIRTLFGTDISEYPDAGKINILPEMEIFDKDTQKAYFDGENNVKSIWEKLKNKQAK